MTVQVSLVPVFEVRRIWPKVVAHLQRGVDLSEGRYDLESLKALLEKGESDLWVVFDEKFEVIAAITSTFTQYPLGRFLYGQFLGGNFLEDWRDEFLRVFANWGRDNGAKGIEFAGRAGWARVLQPNGFREVSRVYQKDL